MSCARPASNVFAQGLLRQSGDATIKVYVFRVEARLTPRARLGSPRTEGRGVASVEGAVNGGRSPAKRTLDSVRNANKLNGLGLVAAVCGQIPSLSGGEDFPALGGGARGNPHKLEYQHIAREALCRLRSCGKMAL